MILNGRQPASAANRFCLPTKLALLQCLKEVVVEIVKENIAMFRAMSVYIKTVPTSGAQNAQDADLSKLIREKTTQRKANYVIGNAKNALQTQKGFQKTCRLGLKDGFTTNLENPLTKGRFHGLLITMTSCRVLMANAL
jgi:hypothetical protein